MPILFVFLLAACGSGSTGGPEGAPGRTNRTTAARAHGPVPPEPKVYEAMSPDERCNATAVRAGPCVDELLVAIMRQLAERGAVDQRFVEEAKQEIAREHTSAAEARDMHRVNCAGDDRYADAVAACWASEGCDSLAACVTSRLLLREQ